jgi:cytoskeletal protein CcmA (bactofilin family)
MNHRLRELAAPAASGTILAPDTILNGTLRAAEPVRVLGTLRGSLETDGPVVVEAGGEVQADVVVPAMVVAGLVTGAVACAGRLELRGNGRILGRLRPPAAGQRGPFLVRRPERMPA